MFLWLISWVALAGQFAFAVFSLAAGLYCLAELIEEYTVLARRMIFYLVVLVVLLYVGLLVIDGFPLLVVVVGILVHLLYGSLLTTFPLISPCSPGFLGGSALLLVAHYLAFQHFSIEYHPFQEVLAFFFLCLWLVPFSIFISLSANDSVLPTIADDDGTKRRPRRSGFLAIFDFLARKIDRVTPSRSSKYL